MTNGTLFIVSAPSGAGKTSLVNALQSHVQDMTISVSHTTRGQREGEVDGKDYYFVNDETFSTMLERSAFLEHARVFDHYYGTARVTVEQALNKGRDVILEIDWQGAQQIRKLLPDSLSIFILPPSRAALRSRLQQRGQDQPEVIAKRMQDAAAEMSHCTEYDYILVNDVFEEALNELRSIVDAARLRTSLQSRALHALLAGLLSEP